jgi:hypothetical protein
VYSEPKTATTIFREESSPEVAVEPPKKTAFRFALWFVAALLALTAVGLGIVFLNHLRVQHHRLESANRLSRVGLAAHFHHDITKHLPANGTTAIYVRNGRPAGGPADSERQSAGSWAYRLLPVLELNDDREFKYPFPGLEKTKQIVVFYRCSLRDRVHYANGEEFNGGPFTDFVLNPYINDPAKGELDLPNRHATLIGLPDGTANTILFGHGWQGTDDRWNSTPGEGRYSIYLGGTNGTARNGKTLVRDSGGRAHYNDWGSPFADGALICMADGSIRYVNYDIDSELFFQFLHPSDGAKPALPAEEKTDKKYNPFH